MDTTLAARVLDMAIQIQQIPAPTFAEQQRAAFIQSRFKQEGLADISLDEAYNVFARLPGSGNSRPLVVSAHTDTVFPLGTDLTVHTSEDQVCGPGLGDNSLGVAGLFGLLWGLRQENYSLPGDVWLVANSAEEGLGDLLGMRKVVDRFGSQALAYVILEGMALGQVYCQGLGVQRYRIHVQTAGGHSWVDYGRPSAVHILARLVTRLVSLHIPSHPRTTLNVGTISGGTTINSIAAQAQLELDLRSEDQGVLQSLAAKVEKLVQVTNQTGVQAACELVGQRPSGSISARHPLVRLAMRTLKEQGLKAYISIGSTDANVPLSRGLPAICIGLTVGQEAHTPNECIYTGPLSKGLAQLQSVVKGAFTVLR